jgi:hypothetical protein
MLIGSSRTDGAAFQVTELLRSSVDAGNHWDDPVESTAR